MGESQRSGNLRQWTQTARSSRQVEAGPNASAAAMTGPGCPPGNGNSGTGLLVSSPERAKRILKRCGRRHLATVRGGGALRLYVDGAPVAEAVSFNLTDYDLATDGPLQIACGQSGPFSGSLSDVRLYNRPLLNADVAAIFEELRL